MAVKVKDAAAASVAVSDEKLFDAIQNVLEDVAGYDSPYDKACSEVEAAEAALARARKKLEFEASKLRRIHAMVTAPQLQAALEAQPYDEGLRACLAKMHTRSTQWDPASRRNKDMPIEGVTPWKELQKNGATDEQIWSNLKNGFNGWPQVRAANHELDGPVLWNQEGGVYGLREKVLSTKDELVSAVRRILKLGTPQAAAPTAKAQPKKPAAKKTPAIATAAASSQEVDGAAEVPEKPFSQTQSWHQWASGLRGRFGEVEPKGIWLELYMQGLKPAAAAKEYGRQTGVGPALTKHELGEIEDALRLDQDAIEPRKGAAEIDEDLRELSGETDAEYLERVKKDTDVPAAALEARIERLSEIIDGGDKGLRARAIQIRAMMRKRLAAGGPAKLEPREKAMPETVLSDPEAQAKVDVHGSDLARKKGKPAAAVEPEDHEVKIVTPADLDMGNLELLRAQADAHLRGTASVNGFVNTPIEYKGKLYCAVSSECGGRLPDANFDDTILLPLLAPGQFKGKRRAFDDHTDPDFDGLFYGLLVDVAGGESRYVGSTRDAILVREREEAEEEGESAA